MLAVSQGIDRILQADRQCLRLAVHRAGCRDLLDVITRKLGFQVPGFGSTPLQELEWHLHGMLFLFWLGYAYVRNVHVRIDVFTGHLPWRRQAWLEFLGIGIFAMPYSALATYYSWSFVVVSYLQNESSDAPNGLRQPLDHQGLPVPRPGPARRAVLSVLLRKLVGLFGPPQQAAAAGAPAATQSAR